MLEMVVKAVNNFLYHDLSYICVSLSQYLEFVSKLFCSALCTYSRVFDTPVPQAFVCDTSEEANLVLKQIYPHCRCITHKALRHRCEKDTIICIKYGTKEFTQKFQVLTQRHKYMTDHGMKSCNTSFKLSNTISSIYSPILGICG